MTDVQRAVGIRHRVALGPEVRQGGRPLLGAVSFEEAAVFVATYMRPERVLFTDAHETAHWICDWHREFAVRLNDTDVDLFGPARRKIEAEAHFGAAQFIFQGDHLQRRASARLLSMATPLALAEFYGASWHATIHHYAESHQAPVALLVAGPEPDDRGELPIWYSVESESFSRGFSPLRAALPSGLSYWRGELSEVLRNCQGDRHPHMRPVKVPDRDGRGVPFALEAISTGYAHLLLVTHAAARAASVQQAVA